MHKIRLIIEREFMSRVKKKSFLIMTILGPLLFAGITILPVWLASRDSSKSVVYVVDQSGLLEGKWKSDELLQFVEEKGTEASLKERIKEEGDKSYLLMLAPGPEGEEPVTRIFGSTNPSLSLIRSIEGQINEVLRTRLLKEKGIDPALVESIKPEVVVKSTILQGEEEKEGSAAAATAVGFGAGFLIYIFIFLYGSQVMTGVIEEKTNRVVEVIISSVRPFELMMGKIVGVALVGLFQFLLWTVLSFGISSVAGQFLGTNQTVDPLQKELQAEIRKETLTKGKGKKLDSIMRELKSVNIPMILACFVFFFLGGYLLYSALFASVGAAVDNPQDAQQFMLPITIPVIISLILGQFIIKDPNGTLAFWFSIIPFTSPIIMMIRIPFEPPLWQILLSMAMLILGFLGTTWLAARIYRVGILMYGKKVTYGELWKWMRYPS